ncbi:alpha/beta-hydrolase [Trichoderma cornu-damae]|uniref:Alpha/beta-hydrolase n=1 Tax=Trichoderma cornu-damae TaxID=654480 RepID=A0A9P8TUD4_9HYPO|nr:alpha/beta-hydrolase [Trichoderma cornu-damae]
MKEFNAITALVNYKLAPEHPGLAPFEDCWEGLVWFAKQADRYGFDADRLLIAGASAGGGLAAAAAIMARDKGFPKLCGQILLYPMLDDRGTARRLLIDSTSTTDRTRETMTNSASDVCCATAGAPTPFPSLRHQPEQPTFWGLPPAYLEVGAAEPFRDSVVAYASMLWEHGVQAELLVFAGALHGF